MDSTSGEALGMKTFGERSGGAEFLESDVLPSVLTDNVPSLQQNSLSSIFGQDLQILPSLEPQILLPPSPSKSISQDLCSPSSDLRLHSLNVESSLRTLKTSNSLEGTEFGLGSNILSYLNPPSLGNTKFKRGPGRPRKECMGFGKSPRNPSTQKIKSLLGGVRGRKKSDLSTALMNFNTSQSTGESIEESPPRGTDDTAESDSSSVASSLEKLQDDFSMFPELWPGKVCGFCNLGERSMLGQGDLLRLEIPPGGFDPLAVSKTLSPKSKIERDGNSVDKCQKLGLFSRRQKGSGKMKRLISQSSLESLNEPVDEVCGYSDEPEYSSVFDAGYGFHFVHYNCALWCDGVEKKADGSFFNLELEILRALSQRCQHCGNLGAGLMCKADGCNVMLHFPCAAVSGAFQDTTNQTTVCSSHVEALYASGNISGICTVCDSRNDITSLIMCSSCGRHYHGPCMALTSDHGSVNLNIRAGWQCPACKICQACRQPGEEGKLLACDTCDKTYHIFCLRPALSSIPKHSWKCKMCRVCTDCGARTPGSGPSSRWHANFSVCDSCYQQRNKGLACPMCGRAYRHVAQKVMLQCNLCKKYVHGTCDPAADLATYQQRKELYPEYEYICIPCKASGTGLNTSGGNPKVLQTLKRSEESEDGVHLNFSAVSQDSMLSVEDESFPGTDNSNDLVWFDKSLMSTSIDDSKLQLPQQIHFIPKDKLFLNCDKIQKRKFIPGKPKLGEKLTPTLSVPIGRKSKCNEFAKKRGPKPKLRLFGSGRGNISRNSLDVFSKDEEPGVENRMVLCSARDDFVLQQDVCVMCGAFGSDLEGRLISCSQCGQCYHPYCVNVKVTKVILLKGWRCLDCTVCEGCGQRNDESRLILCDECDVSFHIYCIDPPLEQVPRGSWKCKWCTFCHYCGSNDSRLSGWYENYTKCGSCASQTQCPVCNVNYNENDLIIKCLKCERWLHGACDMIKSIKDAEKCADGNYICIMCRPMDTLPLHLRLPPKIAPPKRELLPPISPDGLIKSNNHILVDGIYLSEFGVHQIKSLTLDLPRKKRKKMPNITDMEKGILAAIESVVSGGDDKEAMGNQMGNNEKEKDSKKRQRNLQKLGIGGFLARLRGPRFKEDEPDSFDAGGAIGDGEKPKRKPQKRKQKNKLMETFPAYLQEAFFGKSIMNATKDIDLSSLRETEPEIITIKAENMIQLSKEELQEIDSIKSRKNVDLTSLKSQKTEKEDTNKGLPMVSAGRADGMSAILTMPSDLLDPDLVNTLMNERNTIKTESESISENHRLSQAPLQNVEDNNQKDELSDFLSAQFNLETMESGLPSMDSKDVEDIFKGVLVEEHSQETLFHVAPGVQPPQQQMLPRPRPPVPTPSSAVPPAIIPSPVGPPPAQGSPSVARPTGIQQNLASPVSFPPPSPYHSEYSNSPQFSPAFSEPPSPWPAPVEDVDQPSSYNQRSILKWEADEGLGHSATISAVLYANINHPELKRDYSSWTERSKQIAKIWRGLPADKRAPYLQKARENRAASRMQKAQQDQDKIVTVNQKSRVETQEERHWKQMQALRQQQSQLQESQAKEVCMSPHPQVPFSPGPNTGILRPPRPVGNELISGTENIRQPLHINTPHEQKMSQSPLLQQLPGPNPQTVSSEMAPPGQVTSPMFSPPGQMLRSPVYARPPFISSKPQLTSSNENYGNIHTEEPSRPNCFPDPGAMSSPGTSQYIQKSLESSEINSGNNNSAASQGQETRQHLRDLLQRQQVKKLEQDQMSPNTDPQQNNSQRMWSHTEDWQKPAAEGQGVQIRHPMAGGMPGPNMHVNQFRQPYLPGHPRMSPGLAQNIQTMHRPTDFRMNVGQPQNPASDIRARIMLSQQRSMGNNRPQSFQGPSGNIFQARNPDPYGQLVIQQRMQGGGIVSPSSMLAQQLGRPLQPVNQHVQPSPDAMAAQGQSPVHSQAPVNVNTLQQQMNASSLQETSLASNLPSDHQELPDSVTAELEKLEQEQHNDHNQDAEPSDLADLGMDDDEFLGMEDFNILEYADPELDEVVGGEKTNILDNLDLEEEVKEDKDKRKDAERGVKKENVEFQVPGKPIKPIKPPDTMDSSSSSDPNAKYGHTPVTTMENVSSVLRPAQPPPPYPGPPPPYPGRPQIGIRNGCGLNSAMQQQVTAPPMGMNNHSSGFTMGRPPFPSHISATMLSSNHHLSLQQRKTLLLQEQPLLLEDLLEQEKREQMRQSSGLINAAPEEPLLSDFDFERLKADVLSSSTLPVSLSPPNVVGMMRNQQSAPVQEWQMESQMVTLRAPEPQMDPHINQHPPPAPPGSAALANISRLPLHIQAPPNPPEHPTTEQERQMQIQYEQWIYAQTQVLGSHLKCFETEVTKLRKTKKSLNSKLRQLKKNNNELNDNDAAELDRIGKELPGLQKQLEQARKQSRQHNLLHQDYRTKQQKRQQMMGMSPAGGQSGGPPTQASPLGAASSPLHSTPQSPLMSPSPMQPSPLMQHSPMASPLTPSPGPAASLSQTSPRGAMNPGMHMMDDSQFSPSPDGSNRIICQPPGQGRIHQMSHMRMVGSPGHPIMIQAGGMNPNTPGMVMNRGMNPGMNPGMVQQMQQHRPHMDNQMHRMTGMRSSMPQEHMRVGNSIPRFQRMPMNPEMMMRARPPNNFGNQPQMGMPQAGHYVSRVPFPIQSPTGSVSLRSPSPMGPMTPLGNLGSPPNPMMMSQNRISPASSPMRRPSGSGSIGSPMAERPLSVENPLTPRNSGSSRPHTPSGSGLGCQPMEQHQHVHQQHMNPMDNQQQHYNNAMDHCGMGNMGSPTSHKMHNFMPTPGEYQGQMNNEYNNPNMNSGGGGGGGNPHVIPFPTFSFFDGPVKLGLKGGNPFSVVTESAPTNSTAGEQPTSVTNDSEISQVSSAIPVNTAHSSSETNHITTTTHNSSTVSNTNSSVPVQHTASASISHQPGHSQAVKCPTAVAKIEDLKNLVVSTSNDCSFKTVTAPANLGPTVESNKDNNDVGANIQSNFSEGSFQQIFSSTQQNHISQAQYNSSSGINDEPLQIMQKTANCHSQQVLTEPFNQAVFKDLGIQHITKNSLSTLETFNSESGKDTIRTEDAISKYSGNQVLSSDNTVSTVFNESLAPQTHSLANNSEAPPAPTETDLKQKTENNDEKEKLSDSIETDSTNLPKITNSMIDDGVLPNLSTESQELRAMSFQPGTNSSESGESSQFLSMGESQNALLKQLLQNTGCASTAQVSENVGFSLTSLTKPANPTVHTSHLSEAATRIPQPAPPPAVRPLKVEPPPSTLPISVTIKTEVLEEPTSTPTPIMPPVPEVQMPIPQPTPITKPIEISNVTAPTGHVSSNLFVHSEVIAKVEFEDIENRLGITRIIPESKKIEDEAKKAKRRQYQSKRKATAGKETSVTKKRPRKAGKPEEDFDGFIDNFMVQLRQLSPVGIVEPDLGHSYNICPVIGSGDFSKLNNKGYDYRFGELSGAFGNYSLKSTSDYYNTKPFGKDSPLPIDKPVSSHRGFYNQEFAAPRTSQIGSKPQTQSRTPTPLRESDTPDTIVSSSSPECNMRESPDLFPCLKLIETEEDKKQHLRDSPIIQIACPIPIRPLLATKLAKRANDGDKENNLMRRTNGPKSRSYGYLRENGNITVTLTLSAAAMDEVRVLLRNLANILSIETPTCQMEKIYPPPDRKMFTFKPKDSPEMVDLQCILNGSAKFCKNCDVLVVNNVIKKNSAELLGLNASNFDSSEELCFCSANCFFLFSVNHGVAVRSEEPAVALKLLNEVKAEIKNRKLLNEDAGAELVKNLLKRKDNNMLTDFKTVSLVRPQSTDNKFDQSLSPEKKSWKNIRYKLFPSTTTLLPKYKKPTEKELTEMLFRLGITVMPNKTTEDTRKCALCHLIGDSVSDGPGRLINFDVDKWIHLNCALWSEEVYETENGALVNVELAVKQSLNITCSICKQDGASVKCFKVRCISVYHVGCAVKDGCAFYKNKSVYCPAHIQKGEKENELTSLSVFRRVYVQRDENRQVAVVMHHGDQHHLLRVGSLIFLNVGQLLPHQLQTFHTRHYIYPVGYKIVRFYWSMTKANWRCQYICSIHEADGKPEFRITAQEEGGNEHVVKSYTAQGAWLQVLEAVAKVRNAQDCIKVFPKYITGEDLFGLTEPAIVKVLESLPGIESLTDYSFKYGRNPLLELPLAINPSGCARSEPKLRTHFKRSHTQRTGAFRASLPSSVLSSSEAACPYSKQFVHSKSSQYKKMKQEWRNNVYLARSKIQGLGLYAARDIERHTMVIEYIGEIIRNELAELREKRYESQNRGIYMFRIDDERVIDATLCGGLARYINHSCNPNCVAETVEVERDLRIIIFANRRISRGEELAYDYKFEMEDDEHKIPCMCGAPNCQQWMN